MRENASAEEDRVRAGKGILADVDRLGSLPAGGKIDAVSEQLGAKPADGGEGANAHPCGAIDEMPAADPGVPFDDQLRFAIGLMSEMAARSAR